MNNEGNLNENQTNNNVGLNNSNAEVNNASNLSNFQNVSESTVIGNNSIGTASQNFGNQHNISNLVGQTESTLVSGNSQAYSIHEQVDMPSLPENIGISNSNNNMNSNTNSDMNNNSNKKFELKYLISNKKILLVVGGLLGLIILIIILVNVFKSNNMVSPIFDPKSPIIIKENGKYGYISNTGKVLIAPVYDNADDFYGDFAIVKSSNNYQIIDIKGNIKETAESSRDIQYIQEYGVWVVNDKLYDKNMKLISGAGVEVDYIGEGYFYWKNEVKNSFGIMNYKGKVTFNRKLSSKSDYSDVDISSNYGALSDKYCSFSVNNYDKKKTLYGIVNCASGKVVYESNDYDVFEESFNIFRIENNTKESDLSYVFVNNNKIVYKVTGKDKKLEYYGEDFLTVLDESEDYYSYYNFKSKKMFKEEPNVQKFDSSSLWLIDSGIKEFSCDSGKGLMKKNKVVLSCEWSDINYFQTPVSEYLKSKGKEYIIGEKNDKSYIINSKNMKIEKEFNSYDVYDSSDSVFVYVKDSDTNQYVVYNLISKKVLSFSGDVNIYTSGNYFTVESKDKSKVDYYNSNSKLIYTVNNNSN